MDDHFFTQAFSTYQPEQTSPISKPDGLFISNTGSEIVELGGKNLLMPPFRVRLLEASDPPDVLFRLRSHTPEDSKEITATLAGKSKDGNLIAALRITNVGLCDFICIRSPKPGEADNRTLMRKIPLNANTAHLRLKIDCGPNTAYLLEQNRFFIDSSYRTTTCYTALTEIIDGQKIRRFMHAHTDNDRSISQDWYRTDYTPIPS